MTTTGDTALRTMAGGKECQGSQQDDPEGVRPPERRAEQRDDQRRQQGERASGDQ